MIANDIAQDTERTVLLAGGNNALPVGTRLDEFEIVGLVGEGGFGIVYLAHDHALERRVALKEYMPAALASRVGRTHVSLKSEHHRGTFETGLRSFVNEARLLARFDHPSLVKVYRFWEAHGTAYMTMPFYEGETLRDHLHRLRKPPAEAWLMDLLEALTEAVAVLHASDCYHRDIAPDNILLLAGSGRPLLLDFGAARRVIGDMTQALTMILKPGYAPLEQYAEMPHMKQGPWTDIYAIGAVMHYAMVGRTPAPAVSRVVIDDYVPLASSIGGRYSARLLRAIDAALALRPQDRTPSIDALRTALGLAPTGLATASFVQADPPRAPTPRALQPQPPRRRHLLAAAVGVGSAMAGVGGFRWMLDGDAPAPRPSAPSDVTVPPAAPPRAAAAPFSVLGEFDRIVQAQSEVFRVEAAPAQPRLRIGRDRLRFTVRAQRAGFVYVLVAEPDGSLMLMFPNAQSTANRIRPGQTLTLPQASWRLDTVEPTGTEHFLVLVSQAPRDFVPLREASRDGFMTLKSGDHAARLARGFSGAGSVLAGSAACGAPDCDAYGAARFAVEVLPSS